MVCTCAVPANCIAGQHFAQRCEGLVQTYQCTELGAAGSKFPKLGGSRAKKWSLPTDMRCLCLSASVTATAISKHGDIAVGPAGVIKILLKRIAF